MISRAHIKTRSRKKTNPEIVNTIREALKNKAWFKIAQILSSSTREYSSINLEKINKETKAGDTVVIPGKVLSSGNLDKKVRICALAFSESAISKLKSTKSESVSILDEIKSNPKAQGVKVIR
jgi:large subunit ribosomal protein L18e